MSGEANYETQRIDHHGIVTGISREIELVETIDRKVGQTGRKVSCGEGALAMVLLTQWRARAESLAVAAAPLRPGPQ